MEIKVPALGESITEATVSKWFKAVGDAVAMDEPLVELETDKVTLEVPATGAGTLSEILAPEGTNVEVGAILAVMADGVVANLAPAAKAPAPAPEPAAAEPGLSPAVRKIVAETGIDPTQITGTGRGGRLTKADVLAHLKNAAAPPPALLPHGEPRRAAFKAKSYRRCSLAFCPLATRGCERRPAACAPALGATRAVSTRGARVLGAAGGVGLSGGACCCERRSAATVGSSCS